MYKPIFIRGVNLHVINSIFIRLYTIYLQTHTIVHHSLYIYIQITNNGHIVFLVFTLKCRIISPNVCVELTFLQTVDKPLLDKRCNIVTSVTQLAKGANAIHSF